jgi:hypothetical protein
MIQRIKVDIKNVIRDREESEQTDLMKEIFFDLSKESANKFIKDLFKDLLESEEEFDNRKDVIESFKTVIELHK